MKSNENMDEFYTNLLETFAAQFKDGVEYPGAYIKQQVHGLILRIR